MKTTITYVAILSFLGGGALAQSRKISPDLEQNDPQAVVNVIVQFRQPPSEAHHAQVLRRGGTMRATLPAVRGAAYSVRAGVLADLANDADVVYVSPDRPVGARLDNTAAAINAAVAWQSGYTGSGIGVAVIDSGISNHEDLMHQSKRIVYSQDFIGGGADDHYGHGEHIAGTIAGDGTDSSCGTTNGPGGHNCTRNPFKGMAPGANVVNLRVLDQNGQGTDSGVIAAINRAIQLQSTYNIRVINLSLGRPVYESYTLDPLCQAVEAAWKAGIVVVVAAGNDGRNNSFGTQGYGTVSAPGNDPYVITVGAMKTMGTPQRSDDLVASYSAKGPTMIDHVVKPDLVAPGNQVVSLLANAANLPGSYPKNDVPVSYYEATPAANASHKYFLMSGTSMATAVVSGAAAVLLQAHPNLTPDQVKARLMYTAYKVFPSYSVATDPVTLQTYTSYYDIFTVGAGYLDLAAALADNTVFTGSAASPIAVQDSQTNVTSVTCPPDSICGSRSLWGNRSLWGSQSLWGSRSLWGNRSLWGATSTDGTEATNVIIYGEN